MRKIWRCRGAADEEEMQMSEVVRGAAEVQAVQSAQEVQRGAGAEGRRGMQRC